MNSDTYSSKKCVPQNDFIPLIDNESRWSEPKYMYIVDKSR